jgi:hypothetical protein
MARTNGLMIVGVILLVAGLLGFAIPVFTTQKTQDVVKLGDVKIQSTQDVYHSIPPILSGGVLVLGLVLIGTSLYQRR